MKDKYESLVERLQEISRSITSESSEENVKHLKDFYDVIGDVNKAYCDLSYEESVRVTNLVLNVRSNFEIGSDLCRLDAYSQIREEGREKK
jgi:hypothetical protein